MHHQIKTGITSSVACAFWALTLSATALAQTGTGITISNVSAQELNGNGTSQMSFIVTVTRDTTAIAGEVSVQYRASSGTAHVNQNGSCNAGDDVALQASTLSIPASARTGTIFVTLCADNLDEADSESFTVDLFNAIGSRITQNQATGTVLDDDPMPTLQLLDASSPEGGVGSGGAVAFTIRLNTASGRDVTFATATQGGSAVSGAACGGTTDFLTHTGAQTIPAGATTVLVTVTFCGDALFESNQTFTITASNLSNASALRTTATGTITNDDAAPVFSIAGTQNVTVTEGSSGTITGSATVTANAPSESVMSYNLVAGGTATIGTACTDGVDVVWSGPAVVVPGGSAASGTVQWTVCGDTRDDDDTETFTLQIANVTGGGTVSPAAGTLIATITDDDASPTISVDNTQVDEPASGASSNATVTVRLSAASNRTVTLTWAAEALSSRKGLPTTVTAATGGQACGGSVDFVLASHQLSIPAGASSGTLHVAVCGSGVSLSGAGSITSATTYEAFQVRGFTPSNASLAQGTGIVSIRQR